MLERWASNVLHRFLSKYFESYTIGGSSNSSSTSTSSTSTTTTANDRNVDEYTDIDYDDDDDDDGDNDDSDNEDIEDVTPKPSSSSPSKGTTTSRRTVKSSKRKKDTKRRSSTLSSSATTSASPTKTASTTTTSMIYNAIWSGYIVLRDIHVRLDSDSSSSKLQSILQSILPNCTIVTFHIQMMEITNLPKLWNTVMTATGNATTTPPMSSSSSSSLSRTFSSSSFFSFGNSSNSNNNNNNTKRRRRTNSSTTNPEQQQSDDDDDDDDDDSSHQNNNDSNSSSIDDTILVLDGIHILVRMNEDDHDDNNDEHPNADGKTRNKQQQQQQQQLLLLLQKRRKELERAMMDVILKSSSSSSSSSTSTAARNPSDNLKGKQSWKQSVLEQLINPSYLLMNLLQKLQIHIRDVHIRIEHTTTSITTPTSNNNLSNTESYAIGMILESLHLQPNHYNKDLSKGGGDGNVDGEQIVKVAEFHRFGLYMNALVPPGDDSRTNSRINRKSRNLDYRVTTEQQLLSNKYDSTKQQQQQPQRKRIIQSLHKTICRRGSSSIPFLTTGYVPQHTYLIQPVDGQCTFTFSRFGTVSNMNLDTTDSKTMTMKSNKVDNSSVSSSAAASNMSIHASIDDITVQLRDYQVVHMYRLLNVIKEYKYSQRHWKYRPTGVTVLDNPTAWWYYTFSCVQRELHPERTLHYHGRHPFHNLISTKVKFRWSRRRWRVRQRYCYLYDCRIRARNRIPSSTATSTTNTDTDVETSSIAPVIHLSKEEERELSDYDDGIVGNLSVQDIILYRMIVHHRIGTPNPNIDEARKIRSFWLRREIQTYVGTEINDDEYDRFVSYFHEWTDPVDNAKRVSAIKAGTLFNKVLSIELHIVQGQLSIFAPIQSTIDQIVQIRRLQEQFLSFSYTGFSVSFSLLDDYESMIHSCSLDDFEAIEVRSDHSKYTVISSTTTSSIDLTRSITDCVPLIELQFTKNSPLLHQYKYGVHCRVRTVVVDLVPECEWIGRIRYLIQAFPTLRKVEKFWNELSVAMINEWASYRLGLLAKAGTAISKHSAFNIDAMIHFPVIRLAVDNDHRVVFDLGHANLVTKTLSGIATNDWISSEVQKLKSTTSSQQSSQEHQYEEMWTAPILNRAQVTENVVTTDNSVHWNASVNSVVQKSFLSGTEQEVNGPLGNNIFIARRSDKPAYMDNKYDSVFYDVYVLSHSLHGIFIEGPENLNLLIMDRVMVDCILYRSIIPADHTICRYKANIRIENVAVTLCKDSLFILSKVALQWRSTHIRNTRSLVERRDKKTDSYPSLIHFEARKEDYDVHDDFDEEEFFDAAEETSHSDENEDYIDNDENDYVGADSDHTPTIKIGGTTIDQTRQRQSSISVVSSISDGSRLRRKMHAEDAARMTSDNLVRLEEEDSRDEVEDSEILSFRSAVGVHDLVGLSHDLDEKIIALQDSLSEAKNQLAKFRLLGDIGESGATDYEKCRDDIRLSIEKAKIELKALELTRVEIIEQIREATNTRSVDNSSFLDPNQLLLSARKVVSLLKVINERKDTQKTTFEHNLTTSLRRDVFQCSVVVTGIFMRLKGEEVTVVTPQRADQERVQSLFLHLGHVALALRLLIGEVFVDASVDSAEIYLNENIRGQPVTHRLFVAGEAVGANPSRLDEYDFQCSEEKLLRVHCYYRKGQTSRSLHHPFTITKLNLAVGDLEFTPDISIMSIVYSLLASLSIVEAQTSGVDKNNDISATAKIDRVLECRSRNFDVTVRAASIRLVVSDAKGALIAASMSTINLHLLHSCNPALLQNRLRLDSNCSGMRLVSFAESGEAVEIIGKNDIYRPTLFRIHMKIQLVPEDCAGGWVVNGKGSTDHLSISGSKSSQANIWNCHIGLKVDPIRITCEPASITKVKGTLRLLSAAPDLFSSRKKTAVNHSQIGIRGIPVRWRVDLVGKELHVQLNGPDSTFVASLGMFCSVELSSSLHQGVEVLIYLKQLGIVHCSDQLVILKTSSVSTTVMCVVKNRFCTGLRIPQLELPENFPWASEVPSRLARLSSLDETSDFIQVKASHFEVCLPSKICLHLHESVKSLSNCFTRKSGSNTGHEFKRDMKRQHVFLIYIESALVTICELNAKPTIAISVCGIGGKFVKSPQKRELNVDVTHFTVIDYGCTTGIQCLAISGCNDPYVNDSAFTFKWTRTLSLKQVDLNIEGDFGNIHSILLPSVVKSMLHFITEIKVALKGTEDHLHQSQNDGVIFESSPRMNKTRGYICVKSLEVSLPSKDLVHCVVNSPMSPINVVLFRLSLESFGSIRVLRSSDLIDASETIFDSVYIDENIELALLDYLQPHERSRRLILTEFDASVISFQVLRTTLQRTEDSIAATFSSVPPVAGEQRITNPFNINLHQNSVLTEFPQEIQDTPDSWGCLAQAIKVTCDFVDVLVYNSPSAGGVTDALNTSFWPIFYHFKNKTGTKSNVGQHKSVSDNLKDSFGSIAVRVDGLRFTLVPGGATQLTESPILKFEISRARFGCGFVPVRVDGGNLDEKALYSLTSDNSIAVRHLTIGGWFFSEISASYHNRRLVAWEPFIEPWETEIRFGFDFVRALGVRPMLVVEKQRENFRELSASSRDKGINPLERFGKLLRWPFNNDGSDRDSSIGKLSSVLESEMDVNFFVLASIAHETISLAMYFKKAGNAAQPTLSSSSAPGSTSLDWLQKFGFPIDFPTSNPAFHIRLSDYAPLNLNVTGALIETISEYSGVTTRRLAPHWIRNETGLDIRFHEVLDKEKLGSWGGINKVVVKNGCQTPLSLRRSMSQSCDPHRAFISLELGSFEETIGRVGLSFLDQSRKSNYTQYSYKIAAKIPVDTVGIYRFPLDWNIDRRPVVPPERRSGRSDSLGWIIVRVALDSGIKMVSVESPLRLRNISDHDVLCEVRDHGGLSLAWRCLVKKEECQGEKCFAVPVDIVQTIRNKTTFFGVAALHNSSTLEHEVEIPHTDLQRLTRISTPRPFSTSSVAKGLIDVAQISVQVIDGSKILERNQSIQGGLVHFDVCSLRIGTISFDAPTNHQNTTDNIPEQRLMLFRSTFAFRNYLAFPIQVRVKIQEDEDDRSHHFHDDINEHWTNIGDLACSSGSCWAGAPISSAVDLQILATTNYEGMSCQFPNWSAKLTVPSNDPRNPERFKILKLKLVDISGVPLHVWVAVDATPSRFDQASSYDCVKKWSMSFPAAACAISFFCPFWIVDGTGLDLQYKSRRFLAGQAEAGLISGINEKVQNLQRSTSSGLGELLDDVSLSYLPHGYSLQVLMLGGDDISEIRVRRRLAREMESDGRLSIWSDPISLFAVNSQFQDIVVSAPQKLRNGNQNGSEGCNDSLPLVLRCQIVPAHQQQGGGFGTKLVHIVCRYVIINDLGCAIEVVGKDNQSIPLSFFPDGRPHPFHYDDSGPLRFRPKEFGWLWSGKFNVRSSNHEVIFCLRHKIKKQRMLISVECHVKRPLETYVIIFRKVNQAPYKIENRTMYPIQYNQVKGFVKSVLGRAVDSMPQDNVILPHHNAEFAWDEPEYGLRLVRLELIEFGELRKDMSHCTLGTFQIDRIVPGSEIEIQIPELKCKVIADGPTRVLRVTESSAQDASDAYENDNLVVIENHLMSRSIMLSARLEHGVGISIIDWHPQELVYVRFNDMMLHLARSSEKELMKFSVDDVVVDNQLWVTPFPVLFRMKGNTKRRKSLYKSAIQFSISRSHTKQSIIGGFDNIDQLSLSLQPSVISMDGNLAANMIDMIRRVKYTVFMSTPRNVPHSRNEILSQTLNLGLKVNHDDAIANDFVPDHASIGSTLIRALDFGMVTTAIAAKLQANDSTSTFHLTNRSRNNDLSIDHTISELLSSNRRKIYFERLRVSMIATEISWTGLLPLGVRLPRLLRPALTFEGLPFMVRPYFRSHSFGSATEHLLAIKSHYISIWRIVDVITGVLMKPLFVVRACIYTSRESCSSTLASIGSVFQMAEKSIMSKVERSDIILNRWNYDHLNLSILHAAGMMVGTIRKVLRTTSMMMQYDASDHHRLTTQGHIRSRNPRLFAHIDGNNLLVEYVEGENAGRALLSRVSMGEYLGEGYIYHFEGVYIPLLSYKNRRMQQQQQHQMETEMDKTNPLILMMTYDRILLLHGKLDVDFCTVRWDIAYNDIVYVEYHPVVLSDNVYTSIVVWFMSSPVGIRSNTISSTNSTNSTATSTVDDRSTYPIIHDATSTTTGNDGSSSRDGLKTLHHQRIFVRKVWVDTLLSKLRSVIMVHTTTIS